jgi:hypothetical protein
MPYNQRQFTRALHRYNIAARSVPDDPHAALIVSNLYQIIAKLISAAMRVYFPDPTREELAELILLWHRYYGLAKVCRMVAGGAR